MFVVWEFQKALAAGSQAGGWQPITLENIDHGEV
jgi:hypothetical protein